MIQHEKREELLNIIVKAIITDRENYPITYVLDDIIQLFTKEEKECNHAFVIDSSVSTSQMKCCKCGTLTNIDFNVLTTPTGDKTIEK
jgi:hypothetical protein